MLFCTDLYPAAVPFRTYEVFVTTAAAALPRCQLLLPPPPPAPRIPCAWWRRLARPPLPCRRPPPLHKTAAAMPRFRAALGAVSGRQGKERTLPPPAHPLPPMPWCNQQRWRPSAGPLAAPRPPAPPVEAQAAPPPERPSDPRLVAAVGAAAVAAVPVDRAPATATNGDGVYPRQFVDARNAAAASSAPTSASMEAPVASRPPAFAEAGTDATPAPGATTMPPPAGGIYGGCGGDTTPPSLVSAGRASPLCCAALSAARRPVAGVVAAETARRPLLVRGGVLGRATPRLPHRTSPPRRRASLAAALWADGHWELERGVPTLRLPPTATSAASHADSALHDAAWQPAAAVAVAAAAALSARLAVGTAADGHTSPCLSATARAAAAATPATWAARGAAPAARPLVGTPPPACRQPAPSIGADVRSPPLPFIFMTGRFIA